MLGPRCFQDGHFGRISSILCFTMFESLGRRASARLPYLGLSEQTGRDHTPTRSPWISQGFQDCVCEMCCKLGASLSGSQEHFSFRTQRTFFKTQGWAFLPHIMSLPLLSASPLLAPLFYSPTGPHIFLRSFLTINVSLLCLLHPQTFRRPYITETSENFICCEFPHEQLSVGNSCKTSPQGKRHLDSGMRI